MQDYDNSTKVYNTLFAIGRDGNVIRRYRKVHPYGEQLIDVGEPKQALVSLQRFDPPLALIICFDIMWHDTQSVVFACVAAPWSQLSPARIGLGACILQRSTCLAACVTYRS